MRKIPVVFALVLAMVLSWSGICSADTVSYPGLRYYKQVGFQHNPGWDGSASDFQKLYDQYMKPAYHGPDGDVYFTVRNVLQWDQVLVNENVTPTHTQMRNPNWSGYTWNQGTDEIKSMMNAPCVAAGKCKVSIQLNISATAADATPNFMINEGLGWVGNDKRRHTKFYKPEAVQYASEFILAVLDHYGSDSRIGSVKLGEYYPGPFKPADYDKNAFISGYETLLENVAAGAPRDAQGNRVTIYQANPILNDGLLTANDFPRLKIGVAGSDPWMFEKLEGQSYRKALHGVVPLALPAGSSYINSRHVITWDGTPNPWGYVAGQKVPITLPQVAWFYGHRGPIPMDQEFVVPLAIADRFQTTLDQFGPGGTLRAQWGGVPFAK